MLARLGDTDGAFAIANKQLDRVVLEGYGPGLPYLFVSQTAALRREARFMALAARIGLTDYWRATGNWPDFCAQPGLPYDCKTEAARLARHA